ncbi:MAG TPA: hypothetical protein VM184_10285 [Gaiellaceae bacterium]|nr:hypothetical protein [Gaiellaceae bacterium]
MTVRRRRPWLVPLAAATALLLAAVVAAVAVGPKRMLAWSGFAPAEERLVTGLLVTGSAEAPVVYVTSSDPRIGSGLSEEDLPLDTNSGVISRLTREGTSWRRADLVRGLPRSEENHATNGLALDERSGTLYVAQGGMTNMGAPSARFAYTPEYALSGSILAVDLRDLEIPYDLPTLDDPTRAGDPDNGDPFGGNAGRNQAVLEPDGPVRLHATGLRNPYDVALTRAGRLYTIDNGPAYYWGGPAAPDGTGCSVAPREFGRYGPDYLYLLEDGFYGGHPNPVRANGSAAGASPRECEYTRGRAALATFGTSTNGLAEYTAGNFGGALDGDLLAASVDRRIYRIDLDEDGDAEAPVPLFTVEGFPLDVVAQPDDGPFPGTIWATDYASGSLLVYEPEDRERGPRWERLTPSGLERQEVSYVRAGDRFYLAGGATEHEAYDPSTGRWSAVEPLPVRLDHMQGVAVDGRIYYVGGLESFPEPASGTVLVYDPESDSFMRGAPMPRPRGAGGVAVHDGRIYYAGGLADGEAVPWFDRYDPATDSWTRLPDMPRPRDHFQAQVVDGRFYAIGGRDTDVDAVIGANDAFDLRRGAWVEDLAPMPTPRGGYASAVLDGEIVTFGGEGAERAFTEVEAYEPGRNRWRALDPMPVPLHGIQAVACGGDVYIAAGGTAPYGDAPTDAHWRYVTDPENRCDLAPAGEEPPAAAPIGFRTTTVAAGLEHPTSLQFGPDGRLYVSEQRGTIQALTLHRDPAGDYPIVARERIDAVLGLPNHDDDGSSAVGWGRLAQLVAARLGICCAYPRRAPPPARGAPTGPPDADRGEGVFEIAGCGGCHTFGRAGSVAFSGPPLDHVPGLPEDYVRTAIVDPDAQIVAGYMPGRMPDDYGRSLSERQLADLLEFLTADEGG